MPQYIQFVPEMESKILSRATCPETIEKVHEIYHLEVNPDVIKKCIQLLMNNHDLWFDDVELILKESEKKFIGSFFALKYAFQSEGMEVLNYQINEPDGEFHTEHIINRLKKRGFSPWA